MNKTPMLLGFALAGCIGFANGLSATETFPKTAPGPFVNPFDRAAKPASARQLRALITDAPPAPSAVLELNQNDLQRIRDHNRSRGSRTPVQIGTVKPVNLKAMAVGNARASADGQLVWMMTLDAHNSGGVRLELRDMDLPEQAKLYLSNDAGDLIGPYTGHHDSLWTHTISGERLYFYLVHPDAEAAQARALHFTVAQALLIEPRHSGFCPDNAPCIQDASCFAAQDWPAIEDARKAVAQISIIDGRGGYICSGGLIGDTNPGSFKPYFLTANHCVPNERVARTLETHFHFRTSSCNGPCYLPGQPSTLGASLLHTSRSDDHSLLLLHEDPPAGSVLLGWTDNPVAFSAGEMLYRLSHPNESPQAFSKHEVSLSVSPCLGLPRGAYIYSQDRIGAIEDGSSGAPALNSRGQVVGQLFGNCGTRASLNNVCDAVNNSTVDGAFANYFAEIARWLDPPRHEDGANAFMLWRNSSGNLATWAVAGLEIGAEQTLPTVANAWQIAFTADFDGNGGSDLLWRNSASGEVSIWLMAGIAPSAGKILNTIGLDWRIAGAGDFNGDGHADILWHNTNGTVVIWFMRGFDLIGGGEVTRMDPAWQIIGAADFNGDGHADILWRDHTGLLAVWEMNGINPIRSGFLPALSADWRATTADFNGNGKADILWTSTSGGNAIWLMDGSRILGGGLLGINTPSWTAVGAQDVNSDGKADILWGNANGEYATWLMDGLTTTAGTVGNGPGAGWTLTNIGTLP